MNQGVGRITVAGLTHHLAPVEIRERLAVATQDYPEMLNRLRQWPGVREGALLSTCNRSEVYALSEEGESPALPAFTEGLGHGMRHDELEGYLFHYDGERAIEHLFAVAAGIDSAIIGEPQILGQVRQAYDAARAAGSVGTVLDRLFQHALEVGKRVRAETAIGAYAVSVPYAAVELARKIFGDLEGRPALIIGTGDMGELTLKHLIERGVAPVYVAARSLERVDDLAARLGVELVARHVDEQILAEVDVVVAASAAPHALVSAAQVKAAMRRRKHKRPLFLIDIAVPRNIDPLTAEVTNVFSYNIDDLAQVVTANRERRDREVIKVRAIILEETARFLAWFNARQAVPTVVALRQRLDHVRAEEEARALAKLVHLPEKDREAVARYGQALVNRILHEPSVRLRAATSDNRYPGLDEAVGYLFGLDQASNAGSSSSPSPGDADSERQGEDNRSHGG